MGTHSKLPLPIRKSKFMNMLLNVLVQCVLGNIARGELP